MRNLGKSIGSKAHVRANPKGQEAVRVEGGSGGVPPGTSFRTAGEATEAEPFRRISLAAISRGGRCAGRSMRRLELLPTRGIRLFN